MNLKIALKSKGALLSTAFFFIGIIGSGCILYVANGSQAESLMRLAYAIVGFTFFAGALSVNWIAATKKEVVVYLEKKEVNTTEKRQEESGSQLNLIDLQKILNTNGVTSQHLLNELCNQLNAGQGAIYIVNEDKVELKYGYALSHDRSTHISFNMGEGLVGRVAAEQKSLYLDSLPPDYIIVYSGLGSANPTNLFILPIVIENKIKAVVEVATFAPLTQLTRIELEQMSEDFAHVIN